MANAVIRAVSSVKGLKWEQRHLFLGTLGPCLAPYQVLVLLVVLIFHTQDAKWGSLLRGRRAKWWKNRVWVWQAFLESHVLLVWFFECCPWSESKSAGRLHALQAVVEPPPGRQHLDPETLGRTMRPIQRRALASPLERWVSFRAGRWKGFVFGKCL